MGCNPEPLRQSLVLDRWHSVFYACCVNEEAYHLDFYTKPTHIVQINHCFLWYFFLEALIRLVALRRNFFKGTERVWNFLDLVLVIDSVPEIVSSISEQSSSAGLPGMFQSLRYGRVIRCLKLARVAKDTHLAREVNKVLAALTDCVSRLAGAVIGCTFIIFLFSLIILELATAVRRDMLSEGIHTPEVFATHYGTLGRVAFSLYKSISGGISWDELVQPFSVLGTTDGTLVVFFFVTFVVLISCVVVNIIASIFVDSAVRMTVSNRELLLHQKAEQRQYMMQHLAAIFREIDKDDSGEISSEEFSKFAADGCLEEYLGALEIDTSDFLTFFSLLDPGVNGRITLEAFCQGCLRMRGPAARIDLLALAEDVKQIAIMLVETSIMVRNGKGRNISDI